MNPRITDLVGYLHSSRDQLELAIAAVPAERRAAHMERHAGQIDDVRATLP